MSGVVESGFRPLVDLGPNDPLVEYLSRLGLTEDEIGDVTNLVDTIDGETSADTPSHMTGRQRVIGAGALVTTVVTIGAGAQAVLHNPYEDVGDEKPTTLVLPSLPAPPPTSTSKPSQATTTKAPSMTTPPKTTIPVPTTTQTTANNPTCSTGIEKAAVPLNPAVAAEIPNLAEVCRSILNPHVSLSQVNKGIREGVPYTYARKECAAAVQTGTHQLYQFIHYTWSTSANRAFGDGINCRPIGGSGTPSLHGEGRAMDVGLNARDPAQKARGDQLFAWAIKNAQALGIQEAIWNGYIWTSDHGFRKYTGGNPHTDHVHIGLTWAAAKAEKPAYKLGILKVRIRA